MTDNDIIKAEELLKKLEEAYNAYYDTSKSMPYDIDTTIRETAICLENAIEKIKLQKAEISVKNRLLDIAEEKFKTIKAEAITEFAERLKATPRRFHVEYVEYFDRPSIEKLVLFIDDNDIDQIAKAMKEGVDK